MKLKILSEARLLEIYPPFFLMGIRVKKVGKDYRLLHAQLPFRWCNKNIQGTMFGGYICALSDPLALLLCERIFPGTQGWTKDLKVEFLKPGTSALDVKIEVSDEDVSQMKAQLERTGNAFHTFTFSFRDKREREIARVANTVLIRQSKRRS